MGYDIIDTEANIFKFICNGKKTPITFSISIKSGENDIKFANAAKNIFSSEKLNCNYKIEKKGSGALIKLNLDLKQKIHLDFCGIEISGIELNDNDKFFGTIPGFLEKDGVKSVAETRTEEESATMFGIAVSSKCDSILAGIGELSSEKSVFSLKENSFLAGYAPERILEGNLTFSIYLSIAENPLDQLEQFGKYLSRFARKVSDVPTGWNSWDFYGGAVSMKDIEQEMTALEKTPFRNNLKYLTLDMGWENTWGDWQPNRKFPDSLKEIAEKIKNKGWTPGIWISPLQASMYSQIARERQDLFIHDNNGSLIVDEDSPIGPLLLFDYSLEEVQQLVSGWFSEMKKAGFELFKIDYIYESYLRKTLTSNKPLGKIGFVRKILKTIREAVGNDAHIINCGGNKEAAIGIVDSCRVTVDIHNFWGHIKNNARQISCAFWMNRNLWTNDPDFAIIRNQNNCTAKYKNMPYAKKDYKEGDSFWMSGREANENELQTWLNVVRLNGGNVFLSDSMQTLNKQAFSNLYKLFPPRESTFKPLDLFSSEYPGVWLSDDNKCPSLGIFN